MQAITTLYFPGFCEEALAFYRDAIGAEILFHYRVADLVAPADVKPGTGDRTLRAGMRIGDSRYYLADGHFTDAPAFAGMALTLACASAQEAARMLDALAVGGAVRLPLRSTAWAEALGTVVDRYGLHWTVEAGVRHDTA